MNPPPPNAHKRPDAAHAIETVEDVLEQVCYPGPERRQPDQEQGLDPCGGETKAKKSRNEVVTHHLGLFVSENAALKS